MKAQTLCIFHLYGDWNEVICLKVEWCAGQLFHGQIAGLQGVSIAGLDFIPSNHNSILEYPSYRSLPCNLNPASPILSTKFCHWPRHPTHVHNFWHTCPAHITTLNSELVVQPWCRLHHWETISYFSFSQLNEWQHAHFPIHCYYLRYRPFQSRLKVDWCRFAKH